MRKVAHHLPLILLLFFLACHRGEEPSRPAHLTYTVQQYEGRFLNEWIAFTLTVIQQQQLNTPDAARVLGYVGLTAWEAVCHGVPEGKSLGGQIRDYEAPEFDPDRVYDWGIVLCSAMRNVLPDLFEGLSNNQRSQLEKLAAMQEDTLFRRGQTERVRQDSRLLGGRIAAAINARARNDGRRDIRQITPALPERDAEHPQYWIPTTTGQQPVEPLWGQVKTFLWHNDNLPCLPPTPPAYSITSNSEWYLQAQELVSIPKNTSTRQIAFHWEDGPGRSSTAAGHWINIARQLLEREGSHIGDCARLYCLLGLAVADGCSLSWSAKYQFFLLRPISYIQENINTHWQPLIFTPAHPEYLNEQAVLASTCSTLLIRLLGNSGLVDQTHLGSLLYAPEGGPFVLPERVFPSLTQAGQEAAFAAVIAGTHFRRSCEEGWKAGLCLAELMSQRIRFSR